MRTDDPTPDSAPYSQAYVQAMAQLVEVVQQLSQARSLEAIVEIVRQNARKLTGADGATFVLRDGDCCYYLEEDAISPLWKGLRFPINTCISGWAMLNCQPVVIEDIYCDDRIPIDAYRPTFVKSLAMMPIRQQAPMGAIGNYWAHRHLPGREELAILQALADTVSVALENAQLYAELEKKVQALQSQQIQIREQRDSLDVFTRALAHDLKEPVRTVKAFSSLVGKNQTSPEKEQEYLRFIQKASQRMHILVESVFQYLQLDSASQPPQWCSLGQLLQNALDELQPLIQTHKAKVIAPELPQVLGHPELLQQVLYQLLANALQHSDKASGTHVVLSTVELDDRWEIAIHDNGPGIDPEHQEQIFLPFQRLTTQTTHAGMGLPTCRKIIALHDGQIRCESSPGQGTTIYFSLPLTAIRSTQNPAISPINASETANLLLVDDDESDIELARLALLDEGGLQCNLCVAHNGKSALKVMRELLAQGDRIDLLLLDINMPGMNGFEVLQEMRQDEALKDIEVIICSGSNYDKDKKRARDLGSAGYLLKPPDVEFFIPLINGIHSLKLNPLANGQQQLLRVRPVVG